jgi:hypothetical protein
VPDRRDRHVQAPALAEGSGPGACRIDHDRGADVPGGGVYQVLAMAAEGEAGDARMGPQRHAQAVCRGRQPHRGQVWVDKAVARGKSNGFDAIKVQDGSVIKIVIKSM